MLLEPPVACRGQLTSHVCLAPHTSWHVGGPAEWCYEPLDAADLSEFLAQLPPEMPVTWLGLGSNVLIRDTGLRGVVILTQGTLGHIELLGSDPAQELGAEGSVFKAECGVTCAKLAKVSAKEGFGNGAFFAGIPGTVGGALAMNAGAYGGVTWEHVIAVDTIDHQGIVRRRMPHEFTISYRHVVRPDQEWFLAGYFQFASADAEEAKQTIKTLLRQRGESQPIGEFSCGSVFRNPPGDFSARLIETAGLKGLRIGGAWVSTKHANFIINGGEATAADIEQLIQTIQAKVKETHQVMLIPECHILGQ